MANETFNSGVDHFGLQSGTSNALKVVSSSENISKQSQSGPNNWDDPAVVDSWGETADPSSEYEVVSQLVHALATPKITLGALVSAANSGIEVSGAAAPLVVGRLSIRTQTGSAPRVIVTGKAVQTGATQLRAYIPPALTLLARHRAQDFMSLCTIKKGSGTLTVADGKLDYGMQSVNADFPITITLSQPKGVTMGYDLHGDMITVDFTMNWYATGKPTIVLVDSVTLRTSSASSANTSTVTPTMSTPKSAAHPEGGYTQYTWQVQIPFIGYEVS